jgi:cytochrome b561
MTVCAVFGPTTLETAVNDANRRYPPTAVILHWAVAVGVLVLLVTGTYMVDLAKNTDQRAFFFNLHKSIGILTGAFILGLIGWRTRGQVPGLPVTMPRWEQQAAAVNHALFYLLLIVVTTAGYLTSSFSKYGPKLFGLPMPHWGWDDAVRRGQFADWHRWGAWVLAMLIVLHLGAALKHLVLDRDGVFQRMLPGGKPTSAESTRPGTRTS